jgi:AcrR family transcriptional regulator
MGKRRAPSTRKQPSQERSRQTVAAILEAATHVFSSEGYGAATTARIAERAGVSVGSLYQFFSNKEELLLALGLKHVEESHAWIEHALDDEALGGLSLEALVRTLTRKMIELHQREPTLHRLLFQEVPRQQLITEAKAASDRALLRRFELMLRSHPEVRVRDPRLTAALVGQVLESLTHWFVLEAKEPSGERGAFVDEVTFLLCAYLSARAERKSRPPRADTA